MKNVIEKNNLKKVVFLISSEKGNTRIPKLYKNKKKEGTGKIDAVNKTLYIYLNEKTKIECFEFNHTDWEELEEINFNNSIDFSDAKNLIRFFYNCKNLKKIDFGNIQTLNLNTTEEMFAYCNQLEEIKGWDFKCFKLKTSKNMFRSCSKLKKLDFSNANFQNLVNGNHMFSHCENLKKINMENVSFLRLQNAESMFEYCYDLEEIEIKCIKGIMNACCMFLSCKNLQAININFEFDKIENIWGMFMLCKELKSFNLQLFHMKKIRNCENMFNGCSKLEGDLIFPEMSITGVSIKEMFSGCTNLRKIDMSRVHMDAVNNMNQFALNCYSLISIEMGHSTADNLTADYFSLGCELLKYISLQNMTTKIVNSASCFAHKCKSLKVVRLGFPINNAEYTSSIFNGCTELRMIECPTKIYKDDCSFLQELIYTKKDNIIEMQESSIERETIVSAI